jgi:hypothetical protein
MLDSLRGRVPSPPPVGAVVERDGPIIRTHYGTHGTVDHAPLTPGGLDALVARQVEAFASRGEPAEWKVYAHDEVDVTPHLLAAGFTPGWERAVLVSEIRPGPDGPRHVVVRPPELDRVVELAATGRHRRPLVEVLADGWSRDRHIFVDSERINAAVWAEEVTPWVVLDGVTDPGFAHEVVSWNWRFRHVDPGATRLLAEADGELRAALEAAGMRTVTTVTSYHWRPATPPPATRPVTPLLYEAEHDEIWARFKDRFTFRPDMRAFPGITEPETSATWSLRDCEESAVDELDEIVHSGLGTATRPGEQLYALDWQHVGYRFDPRRVGGRGPRRPGGVFPGGDYSVSLTPDLRLGTFGHPWEETLCVFGEPLLAAVEARLTALLGPPVRRGGK